MERFLSIPSKVIKFKLWLAAITHSKCFKNKNLNLYPRLQVIVGYLIIRQSYPHVLFWI